MEKIINSAENEFQLKIVRSLLNWSVFTTAEEKSAIVVIVSSDFQILDKIRNIDKSICEYIHHVPIGHGTNSLAKEFLSKFSLDDLVKNSLLAAFGGHFSVLSAAIERMRLHSLTVEVAISEVKSRFKKHLMKALNNNSPESLYVCFN